MKTLASHMNESADNVGEKIEQDQQERQALISFIDARKGNDLKDKPIIVEATEKETKVITALEKLLAAPIAENKKVEEKKYFLDEMYEGKMSGTIMKSIYQDVVDEAYINGIK